MLWWYNLRFYVCGFETVRIVHPSGGVLKGTTGKIDSTGGLLVLALIYEFRFKLINC